MPPTWRAVSFTSSRRPTWVRPSRPRSASLTPEIVPPSTPAAAPPPAGARPAVDEAAFGGDAPALEHAELRLFDGPPCGSQLAAFAAEVGRAGPGADLHVGGGEG